MGLGAVVEFLGAYLSQGSLGALSGSNRVPRFLGFLVLVAEEQWTPCFTHVPLDVVGEHAQEDVGAYPCLEAVANRTHLEVDGLDRTKCPFDLTQTLVAADGVVG